jgi:exo-beta-1,3-glucanase (GH17 family)
MKSFLRNISFVLMAVFSVITMSFADSTSMFKGVCYSSLQAGQSPANGVVVPKAAVVGDLSLIKEGGIAGKIRTFGLDTNQYLQVIPEVAESLGIDYVISIWLSFSYRDTWKNGIRDVSKFMKKADSLKYSRCKGVIYGYQVISPSASMDVESTQVALLIDSLAKAKKALSADSVKLSYEANWDFWLRHPNVGDSLDFISVRIFPQNDLQKDPVGAVDYAIKCYKDVKEKFPNKEVLVSSIGWSTESYYGSCEREQKIFLDTLRKKADFDYFVFSFADEDWKPSQEQGFGIFDKYRQAKKVVYKEPAVIDHSELFKQQKGKFQGLVFQNSFNYPQDMAFPVLKERMGEWADTMNQLSGVSFFNSYSIKLAKGEILDIFRDNGNQLGTIDYDYSYQNYLEKYSFKFFSRNFGITYLVKTNTKADSIDLERLQDNVRREVLYSKSRSLNDSVLFLALGNIEVIKAYGSLFEAFDGYVFETSTSIFYDKKNTEAFMDSLFGDIVGALGKKKLVVNMNIGYLDGDNKDKDVPIFELFLKMKEKYGFYVVISGLNYLYDASNGNPRPVYKYLFPERFPAGILSASGCLKNIEPRLAVSKSGFNIFSNQEAVLSLYNAQGKVIKRINLSKGQAHVDIAKQFSAGLVIARLRTEGKVFSAKFFNSGR